MIYFSHQFSKQETLENAICTCHWVGVRIAVCVRILNSFLDNNNRTAFTSLCFDIESVVGWSGMLPRGIFQISKTRAMH